MEQIPFFAIGEDILLVLEAVERAGPLQNLRTGNPLAQGIETFLRGTDIPNLGVADHQTGSVCKAFLVTKATVPTTVICMKGASGVQRYLMDQLLNPDTATLTLAGIWGKEIILQRLLERHPTPKFHRT